jgi:hypothetical protein
MSPKPEHAPHQHRRRFVCPHCEALSQQQWSDLYNHDGEYRFLETRILPGEEDPWSDRRENRWYGAQCGGCDHWSLWRDGVMVYPHHRLGSAPHEDMPSDIRSIYIEAATAATVSRRAGAALARAMVERLIKHIDPDAPRNAKLDKRIDRIHPRVSTSLSEMLEVVRHVGNKLLHADTSEQLGELIVMALDDTEGPQLVELLLTTANDLVDELITKPRITAELREHLPEAIQAKLAEADSSTTVAPE